MKKQRSLEQELRTAERLAQAIVDPESFRDRDDLRREYRKAVRGYIKLFQRKHGLRLEYWIADDVGGTAYMGDYYFNFDDIRLDIDRDMPKNAIIEWYDHTLELHSKGLEHVNYYAYCLGLVRKSVSGPKGLVPERSEGPNDSEPEGTRPERSEGDAQITDR